MLQASTGKLFTYDVEHTNILRGILHTNMVIYDDNPIDIGIGKLTSLSMRNHPNIISCEIIENIESPPSGRGILVSNTIDVYIEDFADIISFFLGVICTPDAELAKRLLNEKSRSSLTNPKELISRMYEEKVHVPSKELEELQKFSTDLIALSRKQYLLVINAIRTYVTAVHRLGDNLELAYTLFVMSLEALVKDTKEYESSWDDVDEGKRRRLDAILKAVDPETAKEIRASIVESEHLAVTKKFNVFISNNVPENYFKDDARLQLQPIGKADLKLAIPSLYKIRSKFVHELQPLPKQFYHLRGPAEVQEIDGDLHLTFQGLSRLARNVIKEFVRKQEKIAAEPCNYSTENPNLIQLKMCPSCWISSADGLNKDNCSFYLNSYMILLDKYYEDYPNGKVYDVREVITKGFSIKSKLNTEQRTSIVILAAIFFSMIPPELRPPIKISKTDDNLTEAPSIQTLVMAMFFGKNTDWALKDHEQKLENYYKSRLKPARFQLPKKLEACLDLAFAEKLRLAGEHERAKTQLDSTADNFPSFTAIRELSENYDPNFEIDWLLQVYPNLSKAHP